MVLAILLQIEEVMSYRVIRLSLDYLSAIKSYGCFTEGLFNQSMVILAVIFFARADICEPQPQTRTTEHACIIRGACVYVHGACVCVQGCGPCV